MKTESLKLVRQCLLEYAELNERTNGDGIIPAHIIQEIDESLAKNTAYIVVDTINSTDLEQLVEKMMNEEGYKLYGAPFAKGDRFCQALIRETL